MRIFLTILLLWSVSWQANAAVSITPFGLTNRFLQITNGVSYNLTNLGQAYSDRLVVTNLVVGTTANTVVASNGNIKISGAFQSTGSASAQNFLTLPTGGTSGLYAYMCCGNIYDAILADGSGSIPNGVLTFSRTDTFDQLGIRMGNFTDARAIQFTKTNGFLYLTGGDSTYASSTNRFHINEVNSRSVTVTNSSTENVSITNGVVNATKGVILPASTPFTAPNSLGIQGAHLWSDGTNLCVVLQNSAGTRTTNKVTMTAWP